MEIDNFTFIFQYYYYSGSDILISLEDDLHVISGLSKKVKYSAPIVVEQIDC